jgi:hypothetical protein
MRMGSLFRKGRLSILPGTSVAVKRRGKASLLRFHDCEGYLSQFRHTCIFNIRVAVKACTHEGHPSSVIRGGFDFCLMQVNVGIRVKEPFLPKSGHSFLNLRETGYEPRKAAGRIKTAAAA